ncbi:TP53I3 [Bugula neritina]|uniref:TP53I3 n=1 Tax=Bugula neritina TaxID=10212 RepID=A0A7J7JBB4_BUGNE|nr:TP53I3 [Bugula neritina]
MATMRAVQYESGCLPEQMQIKQVPRPTLRSGEILIKVHSSAINRAETLQRKGLYPPIKESQKFLGLEAAGEVVETHEVCHKTWNIGDHVMALLPDIPYAVHDVM